MYPRDQWRHKVICFTFVAFVPTVPCSLLTLTLHIGSIYAVTQSEPEVPNQQQGEYNSNLLAIYYMQCSCVYKICDTYILIKIAVYTCLEPFLNPADLVTVHLV